MDNVTHNKDYHPAGEDEDQSSVAIEAAEAERQTIEATIRDNLQEIILPRIDRLASSVSREAQAQIEELRHDLIELTAPFTHQLGTACDELTPTELRVCQLIRRGLSSKQIARIEQITPGTVNVHREHIRRKLGLTNTRTNLTAYLQSIENNAIEH